MTAHFQRCFPTLRFLLCLVLWMQITLPVHADENRFWLASQMDFGAHRGFYLDFENSSPANAPCQLGTLRMILAVADGKNWRFLTVTPPWQYGHAYHVRAIITPQDAQLWLDGRKLADQAGEFAPQTDALIAGMMPNWAHGAADYWVVPSSITAAGGTRALSLTFPLSPDAHILHLWEPQAPLRVADWEPKPSGTLTLDATFHLSQPPADLHTLVPFVDAYGQSRYGNWPGKLKSDADFARERADEDRRLNAWANTRSGYDAYGGWRRAGWHGTATGYFQAVQHEGTWWLLTPDGNPCFYTSVCTAPAETWERTPVTGREDIFAQLPPHNGLFAAAWGGDAWGSDPGIQSVAFCASNLIRKYGADWQKAFQQQTVRRIRAWGFSGLGKWSDMLPSVPSLPVLSDSAPLLVRHPDIFDPNVRKAFVASLQSQITPHLHDPDIVGWSLGNEYDGIVTPAEITTILAKPGTVPAKRALVSEALKTLYGNDIMKLASAWGITATTEAQADDAAPKSLPAADVEALRQFYADRLYAFIYRTVKTLDPNHLYFGFWIVPNWWVNAQDWRMIARHCDVIGYDNYAFTFADQSLQALMRQAGKPVLCGEFSFPPQYHGARGFGLYDAAWATSDADAGRLYTQYLDAAARNPYCVGISWFQYRDEPLTGRGPGHGPDLVYGEHYAFGLVDITDQPKWNLVTAMRQANLSADILRLDAAKPTRRLPDRLTSVHTAR